MAGVPERSVTYLESGLTLQLASAGTYTFPISFEIPSHLPTSLECDGGSVKWKLVAKVRRPGVFTSKLTATREVQVVSIPAESDVETTGEVLIEKPWDNQLQYLFIISGKVLTIGSSFNVKMSFLPLDKIRIYKLAVDLEGRQFFLHWATCSFLNHSIPVFRTG
jgi:hypothetical protein